MEKMISEKPEKDILIREQRDSIEGRDAVIAKQEKEIADLKAEIKRLELGITVELKKVVEYQEELNGAKIPEPQKTGLLDNAFGIQGRLYELLKPTKETDRKEDKNG